MGVLWSKSGGFGFEERMYGREKGQALMIAPSQRKQVRLSARPPPIAQGHSLCVCICVCNVPGGEARGGGGLARRVHAAGHETVCLLQE